MSGSVRSLPSGDGAWCPRPWRRPPRCRRPRASAWLVAVAPTPGGLAVVAAPVGPMDVRAWRRGSRRRHGHRLGPRAASTSLACGAALGEHDERGDDGAERRHGEQALAAPALAAAARTSASKFGEAGELVLGRRGSRRGRGRARASMSDRLLDDEVETVEFAAPASCGGAREADVRTSRRCSPRRGRRRPARGLPRRRGRSPRVRARSAWRTRGQAAVAAEALRGIAGGRIGRERARAAPPCGGGWRARCRPRRTATAAGARPAAAACATRRRRSRPRDPRPHPAAPGARSTRRRRRDGSS